MIKKSNCVFFSIVSSNKITTLTGLKKNTEVRRSQRLENLKKVPYHIIDEDSDSDNSTVSSFSVNVGNGKSDSRVKEPSPVITMSTESTDSNVKLKIYQESHEYWK